MKIAIYPGSFDPITNGHIEIIKRAVKVFDKVIILVSVNPDKKSNFTQEERVNMIKDSIKGMENVSVDSSTGLTVSYCQKVGASVIIRGLRAVTDFEYELKLAEANHYIDPNIEELFFMSNPEYGFISSSMVNEFAKSGVDISKLVPEAVIKAYKNK